MTTVLVRLADRHGLNWYQTTTYTVESYGEGEAAIHDVRKRIEDRQVVRATLLDDRFPERLAQLMVFNPQHVLWVAL